MNDLITGHPALTLSEGDGKITSKLSEGAKSPSGSQNENDEILERTAHSAVLSLSKAKKSRVQVKGVEKGTLIDDVTVKAAKVNDGLKHELAAVREEQKSGQGGSFSGDSSDQEAPKDHEAELVEAISSSSDTQDKELGALVQSLQALNKKDCRRILSAPAGDPIHAIKNLLNTESQKRLSEASKILRELETEFTEQATRFETFADFENFVKQKKHAKKSDQVLADLLGKAARGFNARSPRAKAKKESGKEASAAELEDLFDFLACEDHRLERAKQRFIRDLHVVSLRSRLRQKLGTEKFNYRLEAVCRFSQVQKLNPLDKLRQKLIAKLGGDKELCAKAKAFHLETKLNWGEALLKIGHAVADFTHKFLDSFLSLLSDVNIGLAKDLKPAPVVVDAKAVRRLS